MNEELKNIYTNYIHQSSNQNEDRVKLILKYNESEKFIIGIADFIVCQKEKKYKDTLKSRFWLLKTLYFEFRNKESLYLFILIILKE